MTPNGPSVLITTSVDYASGLPEHNCILELETATIAVCINAVLMKLCAIGCIKKIYQSKNITPHISHFQIYTNL